MKPPLTPDADGALHAAGIAPQVVTSARLHATIDATGVHGLHVWGGGAAADLRFEPPLPAESRVRIEPNRIDVTWATGSLRIEALPRTPALLLTGDLPTLRLAPPRTLPAGFDARARLRPHPLGVLAESAWAATLLSVPGGTPHPGGRIAPPPRGQALLSAGADVAEAVRAHHAASPREIDAYLSDLHAVLDVRDPLLRSLFVHGLHAARSARKELADGRFAGLAAGVGYAVPARTYYRDSYWSMQALLPLEPDTARAQLDLLAREIDRDGCAPSGVIVASPAGERLWAARRAADPALAADHPRDGIWWADHTDSPLYFVLACADVADWTRRPDLLSERVGDATLRDRVVAVLRRAHATLDRGLPRKPPHDRDWADNVFRGGAVTYDVGLYHGALLAAARLMPGDPARARRYRLRALALRRAARERLWDDARGHYVEFVEPSGRSERHLAIDTLTALRFDLADARAALRTLAAIRATLETRHNHAQPWGDWGVMSVYPPYAPWVRRRGKSRFPFRYHNGADWPYWDGVYVQERMRRGLAGWYHPLTRWWAVGLAQGRATPVEYASPPFAPGSPVNAWSSMPAAAMLIGGFTLTPDGRPLAPPGLPRGLHWCAPDDPDLENPDGRPLA
jgi:hypothetical protein